MIRKGAQVTCKVTSELSRPQSPGRIDIREIPIEVTVRIWIGNELILLEYEKRVNRYYLKDPFKNVTNSHEQVDHDGTLYNCIVDQ